MFRYAPFRSYALSRACAGAGNNLFQAAVLWQVYELTGSAAQLGIVGLIRIVPTIGLNLVAGAVADTYDRRRIMLAAQSGFLLTLLVMIAAVATGTVSMPLLYVLILVSGVVSSFDHPARQGLIPALVPRDLYRSAVIVNQTVQATASVSGPALAGVLIAVGGVGLAYGAHAVLLVTSLVSLLMIRVDLSRLASGRGVSLTAIREGLGFVWTQKVVLGAMTLDLVAVIFGGARTLLPLYAVDILHAGPTGYGALAASSEIGSLLCALALLVLPKPVRAGRAMLISVAAFGLCTIAFGLSTSLLLSLLFYGLVGAADQVSVVIRHTMIQLNTPDDLRGRVTSINSIFTQSSGHFGAVESGFVAAATNAVFAVVSGGAAVLVVVAVLAWRLPELRRYVTHRADGSPVDVAGAGAYPRTVGP